MAITIYPNTPVNVAIVESTAERHHVWIDRDTIYLYTGSDCPQDVQQDRMIPLEEFRKGFTDTELASVAASNDPIVRTAILKITSSVTGTMPPPRVVILRIAVRTIGSFEAATAWCPLRMKCAPCLITWYRLAC